MRDGTWAQLAMLAAAFAVLLGAAIAPTFSALSFVGGAVCAMLIWLALTEGRG